MSNGPKALDGPIFLMLSDPQRAFAAELRAAAHGAPALDVTDDGGVRQRLWRVTAQAAIERFRAHLRARAYIADGHHRYATALRYAATPGGASRSSASAPRSSRERVHQRLAHAVGLVAVTGDFALPSSLSIPGCTWASTRPAGSLSRPERRMRTRRGGRTCCRKRRQKVGPSSGMGLERLPSARSRQRKTTVWPS
jgi:hypothetical protein